MDRCEIARCRGEEYVNYLGHLVCERHWDELMADDAPPDALRMALGIEATTDSAMEDTTMTDNGSKKNRAGAAEAPAKVVKPAKPPKKEKAPKPAKEAKLKREPVENPVVFAFRLSEADRTRIHDAAGPAGATRFVRSAALAAASGDREAFDALLVQAKSNLK